MNIDKLTKLIVENPHGRGSTSRFRLSGGTLWYKDDASMFHPILSHFHTFVVNWGWADATDHRHLDMSSRSSNQLRILAQKAKLAWLQKLGQNGGIDTREIELNGTCRHPAVSITMKFSYRKLMAVEKPTAVAAKMLTLGKHPENGTTRLDWSEQASDYTYRTGERGLNRSEIDDYRRNGEDRYKECFVKPFEDAVASLAYGAVQKENSLRDMSNPLGQMKLSLDNLSSDLMDEAHSLIKGDGGPFAPLTFEEAGDVTPPHNRKFLKLLSEFKSLSKRCSWASEVMEELTSAPDSACTSRLKISTDTEWEYQFARTIGHLTDVQFGYEDWSTRTPSVEPRVRSSLLVIKGQPMTNEGEEDLRNLPPMVFTEHNNRGFSYYWVRKHKQFYEGILSQLGCSLPDPFGMPPHEWNYLELAAPFFLEENA